MFIPEQSFLGGAIAGDLARIDADVVVLGIPHGVPYVVDDEQRALVEGPAAVRGAA